MTISRIGLVETTRVCKPFKFNALRRLLRGLGFTPVFINRGSYQVFCGDKNLLSVKTPFHITKEPITLEQYIRICGNDSIPMEGYKPWQIKHKPNTAITEVTLNQAELFCTKLSAKIGKPARLPTVNELRVANRLLTEKESKELRLLSWPISTYQEWTSDSMPNDRGEMVPVAFSLISDEKQALHKTFSAMHIGFRVVIE